MKRKIMVFSLLVVTSLVSATTPVGYPENNWHELTKLLADRSVSLDWRTPDGRTIIDLQLAYGSEEKAVEMLRRAKASKYWAEINDGSLMIYAIMIGSQRVVQTLIDLGATPNAATSSDDPPLVVAVGFGRLEIMRMLIKAGANVDSSLPSSNVTPFTRALAEGNSMAARLLVDSGVNIKKYKDNEIVRSMVFLASSSGSRDALNMLYEGDFDFKGRRNDGNTPLTFAVKTVASKAIVDLLLMYGDPCVTDSAGQLPETLVYRNDESYESRKTEYGDLLDGACQRKL